jgi:hypothetical protein
MSRPDSGCDTSSARLISLAKSWLGREDSNLHIPDWEMPFEMSRKFPHFPRNFGLETFAAVS